MTPSLPSCEATATAASDGGSGGESSFPTVAVAVGIGVGVPVLMLLGCLFFLLLRKSKRSREIEAAQKRREERQVSIYPEAAVLVPRLFLINFINNNF